MDIEDAFTQEAIEAADTNVGGEDETVLRQVLQGALGLTPEGTDRIIDLGVLAFVAGRTYQADQRIYVPMTPLQFQEWASEQLRRINQI